MSSAFVTGATGYTGQALVKRLCQSGVQVYAHVRPDSSSLEEKTPHFESWGATVVTLPWEKPALTKSLKDLNPSMVFALLGSTRKSSRAEGRSSAEGYDLVDYGLTKCLMESVIDSNTSPRFIYLSSVGADSSSPSPYLAVRGKMESELKASGLSYTIAQPSFITGADREEDRPGERFGAFFVDTSLKLVSLLGGKAVAARYSSLDSSALAKALHQAAVDANCIGKTLDSFELRQLI